MVSEGDCMQLPVILTPVSSYRLAPFAAVWDELQWLFARWCESCLRELCGTPVCTCTYICTYMYMFAPTSRKLSIVLNGHKSPSLWSVGTMTVLVIHGQNGQLNAAL